MFCRKCGNRIEDGAKFCSKCGTPVVEQLSENNKTEIIDKTEILHDNPTEKPTKKDISSVKRKKNGKDKGGRLWLVIGALIAVAIGVFFALFLTSDSKSLAEFSGELVENIFGRYTPQMAKEDEDVDEDRYKEEERILDSDGDVDEPEENDQEENNEKKENADLEVRQVDNSNFPTISLYVSVNDEEGETISGLTDEDFDVKEIDESGNLVDVTMKEVYQVLGSDHISVNLVMDTSDSMNVGNKLMQAENAAVSLVQQMNLSKGDRIEIISFDDYVYLEQEFTSNENMLVSSIRNMDTGNMTALYDGLYAGLYQTYYESGAKCVIGFTDGQENYSSYSYQDVVEMSRNTGIPVFLIGIGSGYDMSTLMSLADECSGKYYSADVQDLETILEDIYVSIYKEQQDYYVLKYETHNLDNTDKFRDVVVQNSAVAEFTGYYKKEYIPVADISGAFSAAYMNQEYILDFSNQRAVSDADLAGKSLAELRIARNEIFARHGRQFKDVMLNQWFYSKVWYLNIPQKYAPDEFDRMVPNPLSKLEIDNANYILQYEQNIMNSSDIYPDAGNSLLSEYDLALSKAVLKTALAQVRQYPSTAVLKQNIELIQEAIDRDDVSY